MKDLPIRDQAISYLTVEGWSVEEIAEALKLKKDIVEIKLTDSRVKEKIIQLERSLKDEDQKERFQSILPYAIDTIENVLKDPGIKLDKKIAAAQDIIDRVMGKPKQTIEHESNLLRTMLEKLNGSPNETIPEAEFKVVKEEAYNPNQLLPAETRKNPNFTEDPVDQWINQNLKSPK
jgi:light-regulated signal transduction histidine kinase (bacteriophytochrome)